MGEGEGGGGGADFVDLNDYKQYSENKKLSLENCRLHQPPRTHTPFTR